VSRSKGSLAKIFFFFFFFPGEVRQKHIAIPDGDIPDSELAVLAVVWSKLITSVV